MANNLSPKHICFLELPAILAGSRQWHCNQQALHRMHPVIEAAFKLDDPTDYAQLCLEWPYVADTDKTRIAFTADDRAGESDRQTLTTVGKYLKRHFPTMADHTIRDLVAKYASVSAFSISMIAEDIVTAVQDGPPSCMQWDESKLEDTGAHPYEVYAPKFGWGIATRTDGRQINARALVMKRMKGDEEIKYFVRTYQRPSDTCARYSAPDEQLAQWLEGQGYEHRNSWKGEKISYIKNADRGYDFVAPYIDGSAQSVCEAYEHSTQTKYLVIDSSGDYECCSQNGGYESQDQCTCEDCNDRIDEDDSYSVGYHGDRRVGPCCIDDYQMVIGRRGEAYHVPNDEAVEVNGDYYDLEYIGEHDIVCLHDGEYASMDDTVYIESSGDWYRTDDSDIVEDHKSEWQLRDDCVELETGEWALEDETWCCAASGDCYLTADVDPVTIHGFEFHPDTSAEDIAAAINAKTGQSNLFSPATHAEYAAVTPAERVAVLAPIVVAPEPEKQVWIRANNITYGSEEHLVTEDVARRMIHVGGWERFEKDPVVTAYPHANSVYETV